VSRNRRILLVEDDPNLGALVEESLQREGYEVRRCGDGEEALAAFVPGGFALCLLDVMLPRRDGFALAAEIRARDGEVPLVFLTAKSLTADKVAGFRLGCDDYVTKPFSMEELLLRIEAVLRRGRPVATPDRCVLGDLVFDRRRQVLRHGDDERRLTATETQLLDLLCRHRERILDRSHALRTIWGDDGHHQSRSMDVFVSRLRKYLRADPRVRIVTVHGRGFRLLVD
jgi:DNA-binding response OmpR family regulator